MFNKMRSRIIRWVVVLAIFTLLIATPLATTPVFAGDCSTSSAGNCGG